MIDKKQLLISTVIVLGIFFVLLNVRYETKEDERITELKNEAERLQIFERTKYLRDHPKELFGWNWWSGYPEFHKRFIKNNVSFTGYGGEYEIEYKEIFIEWNDYDYLIIYYNGSRVFEVELGVAYDSDNKCKEIIAYHRGEWTYIFTEMFIQAIEDFPKEKVDLLSENWGIDS